MIQVCNMYECLICKRKNIKLYHSVLSYNKNQLRSFHFPLCESCTSSFTKTHKNCAYCSSLNSTEVYYLNKSEVRLCTYCYRWFNVTIKGTYKELEYGDYDTDEDI